MISKQIFSLNVMFLCSLIEEMCRKEESDKTGCNFNFGHECIYSFLSFLSYICIHIYIFMHVCMYVYISRISKSLTALEKEHLISIRRNIAVKTQFIDSMFKLPAKILVMTGFEHFYRAPNSLVD